MNNNKKEPITVELLSEMYRNVTMGSENLSTVVPRIKDKFMLSNITSQLEKYAEYTQKTESLLNRRAAKAKPPTMMKKIMSRSGIFMNTVMDGSDKHIAEMISRGTHMGARQLEVKMCELASRGADKEAVNLCRSIVDFELTEADKIKDYM